VLRDESVYLKIIYLFLLSVVSKNIFIKWAMACQNCVFQVLTRISYLAHNDVKVFYVKFEPYK